VKEKSEIEARKSFFHQMLRSK